MKNWLIVGYADEWLKKITKEITASSYDEAMRIARKTFPQYTEIGAYELDE